MALDGITPQLAADIRSITLPQTADKNGRINMTKTYVNYGRNQKIIASLFAIFPITFFLPVGFMYVVLVLLLIGYSFSEECRRVNRLDKRSNFLFLSIGLLFIVIILNTILNSNWEALSLRDVRHYFIFLFFCLFVVVSRQYDHGPALRAFFVGSIFAANVFVLNRFNFIPEWNIFKHYLIYNGNQSIAFGIFMSIASAWMLHEGIQARTQRLQLIYTFSAIVVGAIVILYSQTRTAAILTSFLSVVVITRSYKPNFKKIIALVIAASMIFGIFSFSNHSSTRLLGTVTALKEFASNGKIGEGEANRLQFIVKTSEMISKKPIAGYGIGGWRLAYPDYAKGLETAQMNNPHNDYLLFTAEMGIVGIAALGFVLLTLVQLALKATEQRGTPLLIVTLALMIGSAFNGILRDWRFGIPFMMLLALAYREIIPHSKQINSEDKEFNS
jgi:O-antigen ligase